MRITLKQLLVKTLLAVLRGLMPVKRHIGPVSRALASPFLGIGRFFIVAVGVPVYRVIFLMRRSTSRFLLPAKNRAMYFVTNRYAIHAAVIGIAAVTGAMNVSGSEVRAETFGQDSMLYALVSQDDSSTVEVVTAAELIQPEVTSYMDDPSLDSGAHIDLNFLGEEYVTTTVGGSTLAAPTLAEGGESIAPRTNVETYIVIDGDTLGGISEQFGLSLSSLLWANNLTFRSTIRPGQELTIPPVDGVIYTVKSGDTVNKIAQTYGADAERIISFNVLASADDLVIGESLIIPDGEPPAPPVRRTAPVTSLFTGTPTGSVTGGGNATTKGSVSGSGTWVWPTDWRVITQYYKWNHSGLDIDGDTGVTQSYAAADGVVIYSGWRNGYGYTVEVDHGNGLVTRYAHHAKLYVKVGDVVTAGQAIAGTGSTGRSTGSHLHFEVMKNGKFQNPLDYVR